MHVKNVSNKANWKITKQPTVNLPFIAFDSQVFVCIIKRGSYIRNKSNDLLPRCPVLTWTTWKRTARTKAETPEVVTGLLDTPQKQVHNLKHKNVAQINANVQCRIMRITDSMEVWLVWICTWFRYILDIHADLLGHASKRGEDDEASDQARHNIHDGDQHSVPEGQQ